MANPIKIIKAAKKIKPTGMKGRGTKSTTVSAPKSAVKVKPAARQKAGKKDMQQFINKRAFRNESINYKQRGNDFINSGMQQAGPFSQGKTKLIRQIKASDKKRVDELLKSLPKAPPRTAAEKAKSNRFIEKEINKLKKSRGK